MKLFSVSVNFNSFWSATSFPPVLDYESTPVFSLISRTPNFVTGQRNNLDFVLTSTTLTWPSLPGKVLVMMPLGQLFLGRESLQIMTMSPTVIGSMCRCHFMRFVNVGNYSCTHHCQNMSARACAVLKCLWRHKSDFSNFPGGWTALLVPIKKWLGVSASSVAQSMAT